MTIATAPLLQGTALEEQAQLEVESVRDGVQRYHRLKREAVERGEGANLKPVERMLQHWNTLFSTIIQDEKNEIAEGKQAPFRSIYGPVLLALDAEHDAKLREGEVSRGAQAMAVLTMDRAVSMCLQHPGGIQLARACHTVGSSVIAEINMNRLRKEKHDEYEKLTQRFRRLNAQRINWWARRHLGDTDVNRAVCIQTGAILLKLLMETASLGDYERDVFEPAFEKRLVRTHRKQTNFFCMTRRAFDLIEDGHGIRQHLRPRFLPMVCPPCAWTKTTEGGYTRIRTPFMSKPTRAQKAALATADLERVHDCLNAVNGTPWRPNLRVLAVAKVIKEQGGGVLGMPRMEDVPAPAKPHGYDVNAARGQRWAAVDPAVKKRYKREANDAIKANLKAQGARFELDRKLTIAERFAGRTIYFPHQLDFRGRSYPIPLHLNHQGDDLCRGLLEFAEGKPCVGEAMYWLKVDAANSWGLDKASYDERVAWVDEHMPQIRLVADDAIACEWWHDAEEPWQFLSACYALTDPEAAAHHPVKMDGTANGLQHFTALGRDEVAAPYVNMVPAGRPESLYLKVAGTTQSLVDDDARLGHPLSRVVEGMVDKSTVKQPVMTTFYGVTMVGARDQVRARLAEKGLTGDELYKASDYLSKVVMGSVGLVCPKASAIMAWLRRLASLVTRQGALVSWDTPLGLPVVQPYRRWRRTKIETVLAELVLIVDDEDVPVAAADHRDGFAPNFVHSLDAAHWLMTALECQRQGITAAAVHDQYWTHAATRVSMARILREQFVALHSRNLLLDLVMQLRMRHPEVEFPDPPAQGTYDLNDVLRSPYTFH